MKRLALFLLLSTATMSCMTRANFGSTATESNSRPAIPEQQVVVVKHNAEKIDDDSWRTFVTVRNISGQLANSVDLKVVYYDAQGKVVGTGLGVELNVPGGEERLVTCTAMDIKNAKSYDVEVAHVYF
jgi:hypothetical protein